MERDDAAWLTERLSNGPAWARKSHVEALGKSGDARAAAPLCAALKNAEIGEAAAEALVRLGRAAVPALCKALRGSNRTARQRAAEVLGRIGDLQAAPLLVELLCHPDWGTRKPAARALEAMGSLAVPALCEALGGENRHAQREAAAILGRIGDRIAIPALCGALRRGQTGAAAALGEIALRAPLPELRAALPLLRELARYDPSTFEGFPNEEYQVHLVVLKALWRIEAATAEAGRLPIPAAAPPPSAEGLPLPAGPPAPAAESLPLAAEPPALTGASQTHATGRAEETRGEGRARSESQPLRQSWWQQLVARLRWLAGAGGEPR